MSGLPQLSGRDCLKALKKKGYYLRRQEGSHMIIRRDSPFCQFVIPDHKTLDRGTLRTIIRQSGLSIDEFITLL